MNVIYLSLVILFAQSTWAGTPQPAIIHGSKVNTQDWIAHTVVALVSDNQEGEALCTASIVAADLALTAAHCVTNENNTPSTLTLIFSSKLKGANPNLLRAIDRVEIPAEWNPAGSSARDTSDVALIHFNGGLPDSYTPSDLLPFDHALTEGASVVLAGYGISNARSDTGAGILRKTSVNILNPNYSPSEIELDQTQGGGACHGDSGGPAYLLINDHPYLFGITSRGGGNCDEDVIYTKISAYQDWFTEAVAKIRRH